jgi:Fuc2NAc and GlcNAc transferase
MAFRGRFCEVQKNRFRACSKLILSSFWYWVSEVNFFIVLSVFLTMIASAAGVLVMLIYARRARILDVPSERSSHKTPTPRGGGAGMVIAFALASAVCARIYQWNEGFWWILGTSLGMAALGWWDDRVSLSARLRLRVQVFLSIAVLLGMHSMPSLMVSQAFWGEWLHLPILVYLLLLLFVIWMANLYNFMDGVDGILGLQSLTVALLLGFLAWQKQDIELAWIYLLLASALLGFLFFNWSPARIFMGDVGSVFLGFIFAALAVYGELRGTLSFSITVLMHGAFVVDATMTLLRRLSRGKKPQVAHRSHAYQKLVAGRSWSHAGVSLLYGGVNLLWLFPLAWAAQKGLFAVPPELLVALAWLPLIFLGFALRSGVDLEPALG